MSRLRGCLVLAACLAPFLMNPSVRCGQPATLEKPHATRNQGAHSDRYGDPLPAGAVARIGTLRLWHRGPVNALVFAPDGKTFVSAAGDPTLRLWETASGKEVRQFKGHRSNVYAAAFSPDGKLLASGSDDASIRIWDVASGQELQHWSGMEDAHLCLSFSPDGKILASGGKENSICLWDVPTGKPVREIKGLQKKVLTLSFSPDGKTLVTGSEDDAVYLWDVPTGKRLRKYEVARSAPAVVFSPNGQIVATGDSGGLVQVWETGSIEEAQRMQGHENSVWSLAFSPDGKTLASAGEDGTVRLWEVETGKDLQLLQVDKTAVKCIAFSPDGKVLASGNAQGLIRLWDPATAKELVLPGPRDPLASIVYAGEGQHLVSVAARTALEWEAGTGKEVRRLELPEGEVESMALAPGGNLVALARDDHVIRLLDAATGKELQQLAGHDNHVDTLVFSPNGKTLASVGQDALNVVRLWDVETGKGFRQLQEAPNVGITAVTFSADSKMLTLVDGERTIRLWELATGKERRQVQVPAWGVLERPDDKKLAYLGAGTLMSGLVVSHDSRLLAMGQGEAIRLWNLATGKVARRFDGHEAWVLSVSISPDGKLLASGSVDQTVRLWDMASGDELCLLEGHRGAVHEVAFSPDGKRVVSASEDGTALVWDVAGAIEAARQKPSAEVSALRREASWADLANPDADRAYSAIWELAGTPPETVLFLKERLRPVAAPDPNRIARLVADLDSNRFAVREQGSAELEKVAEVARPALRKILNDRPSLEVSRRLERMLQKLDRPVLQGETLRSFRSIEVLEYIGTADARQVLETLAGGAPAALITHEARASLDRLAERLLPPD